jgi:hypothetical protein
MMVVIFITSAILLAFFALRRRREQKNILGRCGRVITKENIDEIIPNGDQRMTREEFLKARRLRNNDVTFTDMLSAYSDLEDVSDKIESLFTASN